METCQQPKHTKPCQLLHSAMQNSTDKQNPLQLKSFDGESQKKILLEKFYLGSETFSSKSQSIRNVWIGLRRLIYLRFDLRGFPTTASFIFNSLTRVVIFHVHFTASPFDIDLLDGKLSKTTTELHLLNLNNIKKEMSKHHFQDAQGVSCGKYALNAECFQVQKLERHSLDDFLNKRWVFSFILLRSVSRLLMDKYRRRRKECFGFQEKISKVLTTLHSFLIYVARKCGEFLLKFLFNGGL